ncbi:hypothetical protein BON30_19695 [Cystobacter ferrugineus]|uniref:Uncharacterized protein n=2 Tax=Cystobacter ferrugineus TaxID=83449 RepID=A0A1L9BBU6_9BACT|nr:hypothetical protein BON30_19695 [Cystobacter ferrugineus]
MEEVETAGDEMPSGGEESRRDAGDDALAQRLKESYRKDHQEFKSKTNSEDDASHGGTPQRLAEHQLTAELQKAAQDNPKRNVYGSVIRKPGEAAPSSSSAPTASAAPASTASAATASTAAAAPTAPLKTSGPDRLGQAAPLKSPAPSVASSAPMRPSSRPDARTVLSAGKAVGTFLSGYAANHPAVSTALTGAVSEAQQRLAGMKGIAGVAAGNYKGESVVLILAERGLSRETLRALPDKVQDFKAVLSLPFAALPLKRPLGGGR